MKSKSTFLFLIFALPAFLLISISSILARSEQTRDNSKPENVKVVSENIKDLKKVTLSKIGPEKIKEIIRSESSESAKLKLEADKHLIKKIKVSPATSSAELKRHALHGIIENISGNLIVIAHQSKRGLMYQIEVTDTTIIKIKSDTATSSDAVSGLQVGQRIIAFGISNSSNVFVADKIYLIPNLAAGIVRKNTPVPTASPSATLSNPPPTLIPTSISSPTFIPTPTP